FSLYLPEMPLNRLALGGCHGPRFKREHWSPLRRSPSCQERLAMVCPAAVSFVVPDPSLGGNRSWPCLSRLDLHRCSRSKVFLLGPDRLCCDFPQRLGQRLGWLRSGDGVAPIEDEGRDAADSKALRHGFLRAHFGGTFVTFHEG